MENQLRDNNPPETRMTFERLISNGYEQEDAKKLIASVLISEISNFLKNKQAYDHQQYFHALYKLPTLPSDSYPPQKDF